MVAYFSLGDCAALTAISSLYWAQLYRSMAASWDMVSAVCSAARFSPRIDVLRVEITREQGSKDQADHRRQGGNGYTRRLSTGPRQGTGKADRHQAQDSSAMIW